MKSTLFRPICVVADNVLECSAKVKAEMAMNWCLFSVIRKFICDEKDEHTSTDFSRVLKGGRPGYGANPFFLLHFSTSSLKICNQPSYHA